MAKRIYLGIDNKARRSKKGYIGIDNIARKIKKGYIGINNKATLFYQLIEIPINTQYVFTEDGTFTVPADGRYKIELHGGGGGSGGAAVALYTRGGRRYYFGDGGNGGGSGESYTTTLTEGAAFQITIGQGGAAGNNDKVESGSMTVTATGSDGDKGGTTSFGSLFSVAGGFGGEGGSASTAGTEKDGANGAASGSLASGRISGAPEPYTDYGKGAPGAQPYRDSDGDYAGIRGGGKGGNGIVIITYLGE